MNSPIDSLIQKNADQRLKIIVVGDTLLDEYNYGSVKRVCPEFPVPVLLSPIGVEPVRLPGGAANVVYQFRHWNVDATLVGFIDGEARDVYQSAGLNLKYAIHLPCGSVPVKRRFYAGDHPLLRWDTESSDYGCPRLDYMRELAFDAFKRAFEKGADVVILSDYDKGLFDDTLIANIIHHCNENNVPTIVDPKLQHSNRWAACTVFKPNAAEAAALSKHTGWKQQADFFKRSVGCDTVIITQGGDGVVGLHRDKYFEYRPNAREKNVQSVIGAGDSFIAVLAMCGGHRIGVQATAMLAFEAGAEYVRAKHNRPITPWELKRRLDPDGAKILTPEEFNSVRKNCFPDARIVFTNGCFDAGLTKGHVQCLRFARQQGDYLVVGLNTDSSIARLKGEGRPVLPLEERKAIISSMGSVDYVLCFDEDTPYELIKSIVPSVIVKGGDYTPDTVSGNDIAEVVICPTIKCVSTTEKINATKKTRDI